MKRKEKFHELAAAAISGLARREMKRWPPDCVGFTYQPKRPESKGQRQQIHSKEK